MNTRKKLIEVALPLEKINLASAREKSIRHGHPSTLHLWWARRPLAAARAVLFAQLVDDPAGYVDELLADGATLMRAQRALNERLAAWQARRQAFDAGADGAADPGPAPTLDECAADLERQRLFRLIEQLVQWENTTNERVLQQARDEIWRSWRRTCAANRGHPRAAELFDPERLPAFHDPFAGGGAIPLEAQRLGLESYASDLNPVAVLINKAMIEIPPRFAGMPPVNPASRARVAGGIWQVGYGEGDVGAASKDHGAPPYATSHPPSPTSHLPSPTSHPPHTTSHPPYAWKGAAGLADDVRYYGQWMRDEAERRIGHLYPKVEVTAEMAQERPDLKPYEGKQLTVIAWLWARTVKSPNPAFRHVDVPLASTFMLSTKAGKEAYVEPVIAPSPPQPPSPTAGERGGPESLLSPGGSGARGEGRAVLPAPRGGEEAVTPSPLVGEAALSPSPLVGEAALTPSPRGGEEAVTPSPLVGEGAGGEGSYRFTVRVGKPTDPEAAKSGTKLSRGANFRCLMSGAPITGDYIKAEGQAGRMGARLMAIVAEGERGRVYLSPMPEHEEIAGQAQPDWEPDGDVPARLTGGTCVPYGLSTWGKLFTPRQLVALNAFADLVQEAREQARRDAMAAGLPDDGRGLDAGGGGATAYAEAVATYLGLSTDRLADRNSSLCGWDLAQAARGREATVRNVFARQAIPMVWDFVEVNILSDTAGSYDSAARSVHHVVERLIGPAISAYANQVDAQKQDVSKDKVISTDPPYYDNIGYADLSDFFYVWLRRTLRPIFPDLFATLAVPKAEELVATPYRHGGKQQAEAFFLDGMTKAMQRLAEQAHPAAPVTIYYAFKQAESNGADGTSSTGWETFLDAVIRAGFTISGTWPMRTELSNRMIGSGTNALASSIVLVCRPRPQDAPTVTRRDFVAALKAELPRALRLLQAGNIAPVDLAQAAIGPGMAVFTRYGRVIDASGKPLRVREALALINQTLDEVLAEQEGDFDAETRWAVTWFEQQGFGEGEYGVAETLATARNTSVRGMAEAGILVTRGGKVRLLRPEELPEGWNPDLDFRLTVWETVHHLVRALGAGEQAAAELLAKLGARADAARELAYRLYAICERKRRASEALAYNSLVQSWPEMARLAGEGRGGAPVQQGMQL